MKKIITLLLAAALLLPPIALAAEEEPTEPVTLRITTSFAGVDFAAQSYVDLLEEWEAETGNYVEDYSTKSDEAWKARVLNDFAAGNEPDVMFFYAGTSDSRLLLSRVVPIREINAAYDDVQLEEAEMLREYDGGVYAVSVRPFWEGLFVNTELFERYGLELPTDSEKLEKAIAVFRDNGITPIAISLSDVPHYIAEISILASGSVKDHHKQPTEPDEIPDSWIRGMELIRHLYQLGAFPDNVNSTSDDMTVASFLAKEAAMLIDGSWRANGIEEINWDQTLVMPFPTYHEEADPTAILGGTSMGFYITRRAWNDDTKRDAAVSLLQKLTSDDAKKRLGFAFGGLLRESSDAMFALATQNDAVSAPFQDQMDPEARAYWLSMIPSIADGSADPREVLNEVIRRGAFAE